MYGPPANLQQAQAQLDQARAKQHQAEENQRRQHALGRGGTTQVEIDQADAELGTDTGAVRSASAQVQVASLVAQAIQARHVQALGGAWGGPERD